MITALLTRQIPCLARSRVIVTRAVTAAILGALLSGCVVAYPVLKSQPTPEVVPGLPEDLLSSNDEVLVLVQSETSKRSSGLDSKHPYSASATQIRDVINAPAFMRGKDLISLNETLKLESSSGFGLVWVAPGALGAGVWTTRENLEKLCVVVKDGRIITFLPESLPDGKERFATYRETLYVKRRDAIISALRDDTKNPFERVDGPCNISGKVDWSKKTRSRTIDFFASIPGIQLAKANIAAKSSNASTANVMLLGVAYSTPSAVVTPVFLQANNIPTLVTAIRSSSADELDASLPGFGSTIAPLLRNTEIDYVCFITDRGSIIELDKTASGWDKPKYSRATSTWRNEAISAMRRDKRGYHGKYICSLERTSEWPEELRGNVTRFLEKIAVGDSETGKRLSCGNVSLYI